MVEDGKENLTIVGNKDHEGVLSTIRSIQSHRSKGKKGRRSKNRIRKKLGPAPIIDLDQEIQNDRQARAERSMNRIR